MKNQINHISDDLLGRWLTRTISAKEHEQMEEWAKQSAENRCLLNDFIMIKENLVQLQVMENVNSLSAHQKLKQRILKIKNPLYKLFIYWQRVAAILILPLLGYALIQLIDSGQMDSDALVTWNEIVTPVGVRSSFTLPDGTKVWLNGNTVFKYPLRFEDKERLVRLEGEAFFEVVSNAQKPFVVDAGKMLVQAVGTSFNVHAYKNGTEIETVLVEGKVNLFKPVGDSRKKISELSPGQLAIYLPAEKKIQYYEGNLDKYLAWRQGKILFRNDPLEEVARRLGQWYNVDFVISGNVKNKGYAYTGSFQGESLHQILEYIELTTPVKFSFSDPKQISDLTYEKRVVYVEMQ